MKKYFVLSSFEENQGWARASGSSGSSGCRRNSVQNLAGEKLNAVTDSLNMFEQSQDCARAGSDVKACLGKATFCTSYVATLCAR